MQPSLSENNSTNRFCNNIRRPLGDKEINFHLQMKKRRRCIMSSTTFVLYRSFLWQGIPFVENRIY